MKRTLGTLCGVVIGAAGSLIAQVSTDYRITMSDGIHIEATLTRPSTAPPPNGYPLVVFIHGLGGNKEDIALISTLLTGRGYASLLYDVRGQGSSEGVSFIMGARETQDLREILAFMDTVPNLDRNTRGVAGGSQGGVHAWLAAIHRMDGVKTVARHDSGRYRKSCRTKAPLTDSTERGYEVVNTRAAARLSLIS